MTDRRDLPHDPNRPDTAGNPAAERGDVSAEPRAELEQASAEPRAELEQASAEPRAELEQASAEPRFEHGQATAEPRAERRRGGAVALASDGLSMEADVAADSLGLAVSRLRRRAWRVYGGAAAAAFVAAALAVIGLAAAAMGLGAGAWVRDLAWAAIFGLAGAATIHASRRAGALDPATLARTLEDRDPRAAGLATAVELVERLGDGAKGFSKELAWAHVSVAAGRAVWLGPERAFPSRPLRRSLAVAGAAVFAFGLGLYSSQSFSRGLNLLAFGSKAPDAPAPKATPITGDIALTFQYPRYTGLPQKTVEGTNGEIAALRGTEVRLETRSDREVAKAFVDVGGAALPLEVEGGRRLSGSLQVQGSGSYSFRFEDDRGRTLAVGPPIPIVAVEDGVPSITIESPAGDEVLTEHDAVEIAFDAADDFGVAAVELVFRVAGGEEQRVPLSSFGDPKPRAGGNHHWELSTLNVKPGDTVSWHLRARDNDAVGGGKWGQSRTLHIKIFSEAEHRRELIARVEEAWEQLILTLGDRIEPRAGPRKVEGAARIDAGRRADEKLQEVTTRFADVAAELGEDERAPEELLAAIRNLSRNLADKGKVTRAARSRAQAAQSKAAMVPQLDRAEGDEQREIEQGILYLEALLDRQRLLQIEELSQELAADRRELANLVEQYRDAPSDEAKDAIRQELSRLKARMAELMQRMAQLGKGLQDEHLNAEAMQALSKERDMMSQLDQVEKLLAEGKADEALAELQKLGMRMDEMAQAFEDASRGQADNDPALQQLAQDMEQYEQDLNDLAREQEAVTQATENLRREQSRELREKLARQGDSGLEELRRKIGEARAHLAKIPEPNVPQRMVDDLGGSKERLDDLENALRAKDFDAAQESAARALGHSQSLEFSLSQEEQRLERFAQSEAAKMGELHSEAKRATPLVREVKEKLDELFSRPSRQMTQQQKDQAQRLAKRQAQLGEKAEQLRQQAEKIGQQAPIFDESSQQAMSGAKKAMGDAEGRLRGNDPGGALASERSAQEHLQSLQRGMEEARRQAQQSGGGSGGGFPMPMASGGGRGKSGGKGPFDGKEKVAIPGADQYKAPEEFRKEILDAMKKGSPEGFQENVRDYYQEIVK